MKIRSRCKTFLPAVARFFSCPSHLKIHIRSTVLPFWWQAAVKTLSQSKLPLIALVNNAGISTRSPLEATPIDDVKKIYNTNVFGVHMVTQAFLPMLRASKGRIVNIGSVAGLVATAGSSVYSGSKFALEAITDALRRELSDHQISVSIVEPVGLGIEYCGFESQSWLCLHTNSFLAHAALFLLNLDVGLCQDADCQQASGRSGGQGLG